MGRSKAELLWSLEPLVEQDVPTDAGPWKNPIDAFIARTLQQQGVKPLGRAERLAIFRRVSLDLIGIPPTIQEQETFLQEEFDVAYERLVQRLLDSEQHGVRYARHWLDVMRYADIDEGMPAGDSLYLWRDWVIAALNEDMPYDEFVRAQVTGYRSSERTSISAPGLMSESEK